jgi:hypothetical protein
MDEAYNSSRKLVELEIGFDKHVPLNEKINVQKLMNNIEDRGCASPACSRSGRRTASCMTGLGTWRMGHINSHLRRDSITL